MYPFLFLAPCSMWRLSVISALLCPRLSWAFSDKGLVANRVLLSPDFLYLEGKVCPEQRPIDDGGNGLKSYHIGNVPPCFELQVSPFATLVWKHSSYIFSNSTPTLFHHPFLLDPS